MADDSSTEVALGVWRTEYSWGYLLQGTRKALLSSALVQASWLLDGTKRNKRGQMVRTLDLTVNGREIRTFIANLKRQEFEVQMYLTEAEIKFRDEAAEPAPVVEQLDGMNCRRALSETFSEFFGRRVRELQQSPEWDQLGEMYLSKFVKMMENEYYDCADDSVPLSAARDDRGGSLLQ